MSEIRARSTPNCSIWPASGLVLLGNGLQVFLQAGLVRLRPPQGLSESLELLADEPDLLGCSAPAVQAISRTCFLRVWTSS